MLHASVSYLCTANIMLYIDISYISLHTMLARADVTAVMLSCR